MKSITSINTFVAIVVSIVLHCTLLFVVIYTPPVVTEKPREKVFHLELTALEHDEDRYEAPSYIEQPNPKLTPPTEQRVEVKAVRELLPTTVQALNIEPRPTEVLIEAASIKEPTTTPETIRALETLSINPPVELDVNISNVENMNQTRRQDVPTQIDPPQTTIPTQVTELDQTNITSNDISKLQVIEPTVLPLLDSRAPEINVALSPLKEVQSSTTEILRNKLRKEKDFVQPLSPIPSQLAVSNTPAAPPFETIRPSPIPSNAPIQTVDPMATLPSPPERPTQKRKDLAIAAPAQSNIEQNSTTDQDSIHAIERYVSVLHDAITVRARRDYPQRALNRREEGRVFMKIKIDANGELLEIKVSEESTASRLLIRAAKQAIIEEAPFAQFAQVLRQDTQWFDLNVNYIIARSN